MIVVPLEPWHLSRVDVQAAQLGEVDRQSLLTPTGEAWAALDDGHPVACAGMVEVWPGRAYAWALIGADAGRHMVGITRAIRGALSAAKWRRVEMAVDAGFFAGCRWAGLLGFEREALARAYLPNGHDAWIYAKVR